MEKYSYDEFIEELEEYFDILFLKNENIKGGVCHFRVEEENFLITSEIYSLENGTWKKQTSESKISFSDFDEKSCEKIKKEISENNNDLQFKLNPPTGDRRRVLEEKYENDNISEIVEKLVSNVKSIFKLLLSSIK